MSETESVKNAGRVLAVGAHADDVDVMAGGTVAKLAAAGSEVIYCVLTDGAKGGRENDEEGDALRAAREDEQRAAADILGVRNVQFLHFTDGELENTPDVRRALVKVIREVQPDTILSWDPAANAFDNPARYHRDHRVAAEAVYDATVPAAGNDLYFPELVTAGFAPLEPRQFWFFGSEQPDLVVDISETGDVKKRALAAHKSQMPHLGEIAAQITATADKAAAAAGIAQGEAFRVLRLAAK
jgi:LmbE family N-acetylglucosaminyl deacetylase